MGNAKFCTVCKKVFNSNWAGAKYCSDACKQKAYRSRKSTVTKKVNRVCVRCGKPSAKSMYCSSVCKAMTNREKQTQTARVMKHLDASDFGTAWMKCNENWKSAYRCLEALGYVYIPSERDWRSPAQLALPLGVK